MQTKAGQVIYGGTAIVVEISSGMVITQNYWGPSYECPKCKRCWPTKTCQDSGCRNAEPSSGN